HTTWNPARGRTRALPHGHSFLLAHAGVPDTAPAGQASLRSTTTQIGMNYFQKEVLKFLASGVSGRDATLPDERIFELLKAVPQNVSRAAALEAGFTAPQVADLKKCFEL